MFGDDVQGEFGGAEGFGAGGCEWGVEGVGFWEVGVGRVVEMAGVGVGGVGFGRGRGGGRLELAVMVAEFGLVGSLFQSGRTDNLFVLEWEAFSCRGTRSAGEKGRPRSSIVFSGVLVLAGVGVSLLLPFPPRHRAVVRRANCVSLLIVEGLVWSLCRAGAFFFGEGDEVASWAELGERRRITVGRELSKGRPQSAHTRSLAVGVAGMFVPVGGVRGICRRLLQLGEL